MPENLWKAFCQGKALFYCIKKFFFNFIPLYDKYIPHEFY